MTFPTPNAVLLSFPVERRSFFRNIHKTYPRNSLQCGGGTRVHQNLDTHSQVRREAAALNETFHLLHHLQTPPCHIQQRVRANQVSKSSLFCGAMQGCECAPARSKMPLPLRVLLALQVLICTRPASLSLKELETLQMYLRRPRCSHPPTHRSPHPLAHTTLPGTRESTHNKRPGPATPRRRLGPRSAASFDNDKPLARLLGPGSPPLTTWRKATHPRPRPRPASDSPF